jgi:hypothetical protein
MDNTGDKKNNIIDTIFLLPSTLYSIFLQYVEEIQSFSIISKRNYELAKMLDPYNSFGYSGIMCIYIDEKIKQLFNNDHLIHDCCNYIQDHEIPIVKNISVVCLLNDMSIFKSAHTIYVGTNKLSHNKFINNSLNYVKMNCPGEVIFSNSLHDLMIEILYQEYYLKLPNSLKSLTINECNKSFIELPEGLKELALCTSLISFHIDYFPKSLERISIWGPFKICDEDNIKNYNVPKNVIFEYHQFPKCSCGRFKRHGHYC